MEKISEHVYAAEHQPEVDRPWIGYVKGTEHALLIDAGNSPAHAELIRGYLRKKNLPDPDRIVLTHAHWDHSFGLAGWKLSGEDVYAGDRTCALLTEMASWSWSSEEFEEHVRTNAIPLFCREHILLEYPDLSAIRVVVPGSRILSQMTLDLGEVTCVCIPVSSPHTEDCTVYYMPEDQVLFVGDAYCEEVIGTDWIDRPEKRKAFIDRIGQLDFAKCVTGHHGILSREAFLSIYG